MAAVSVLSKSRGGAVRKWICAPRLLACRSGGALALADRGATARCGRHRAITPGPVFTTATFIGYVLAGPKGGVLATIGIFLPAFIFVAISGPLVPRIRRSPIIGAFLDGVVIASLGLMAVVTWQLLHTALVDWITLLLAAVSALLLFRCKTKSAWLVLGGR